MDKSEVSAPHKTERPERCPHTNTMGHEWESWCVDCGKRWQHTLPKGTLIGHAPISEACSHECGIEGVHVFCVCAKCGERFEDVAMNSEPWSKMSVTSVVKFNNAQGWAWPNVQAMEMAHKFAEAYAAERVAALWKELGFDLPETIRTVISESAKVARKRESDLAEARREIERLKQELEDEHSADKEIQIIAEAQENDNEKFRLALKHISELPTVKGCEYIAYVGDVMKEIARAALDPVVSPADEKGGAS